MILFDIVQLLFPPSDCGSHCIKEVEEKDFVSKEGDLSVNVLRIKA